MDVLRLAPGYRVQHRPMVTARLDAKDRRRCRNGVHRLGCSGDGDSTHAVTERQRCTPRGHVRGCGGETDRRHVRPSRTEAAKLRWERQKGQRRSVAAKLREAARRTARKADKAVVGGPHTTPAESFAQNGKIEGHGEYEYRAVTELSGTPESERGSGRRDKETESWLSGGVAELKGCPLLWLTDRSWTCLICADVLDTPSQARVHAMGHIDPIGLPTNPPRPKRTTKHLDPVRTSGYIVTGKHRKRRGPIPPALTALATAKLAEYQGWSWYPAPSLPRPTMKEASMPSTPVARWDSDEPVPVRPNPLETPEQRRLINEARARDAAGVPYVIPPAYAYHFPDYIVRSIERRNAGVA